MRYKCLAKPEPNVDFRDCDSVRVDFANVDLRNAQLQNTNLISANLKQVNLSGADLGVFPKFRQIDARLRIGSKNDAYGVSQICIPYCIRI